MIDMRGGSPVILAVSNQSTVNKNSEYCNEMGQLAEGLLELDKITVLERQTLKTGTNDEGPVNSFLYFTEKGEKLLAVPLTSPGTEDKKSKFLWIIEYFGGIPDNTLQTASLLMLHYREAVWYYADLKNSLFKSFFRNKKYFSPGRILIYLLLVFIFVAFFRVSQNVVAEFELVPYDEVVEYAPFDGIIKSAEFKNGQRVQKGDVILKYDTEELTYNIEEAKAEFNEIDARLDWIKQKSFDDKKLLGRVRVLALEKEVKKIEIDKTGWFLKKAKVKSETSGILALDENEKWNGRAVKSGDKLFEIVPPGKMNAEVMLNEKDASVLGDDTNITLYLHSRPEMPVSGKIISVSPKPMLTEKGQFCYIIKMKLDKLEPGFIVGMRGVARVSGEKVSIGYYLFKNLVLWWRKI